MYLVLYPGLGNVPGVLGWTSTGAYAKERTDFDDRLKPLYEKYAKMDVEQIAADAAAQQTGQRMFLTYCSPCHGSDAGGGRGFPNLTDKNWLYGGAPDNIITTITNGRIGVMPAFGPVLGEEGVRNVVAYVRSLTNLPHDNLRAQLGKPIFMANCAACHGPEGKGNQAMGAPNLTSGVWMYGSSERGHDRRRHQRAQHRRTPAARRRCRRSRTRCRPRRSACSPRTCGACRTTLAQRSERGQCRRPHGMRERRRCFPR